MSRSALLLDVVLVLALGLVLLLLSNSPASVRNVSETAGFSASSTLAVVPSVIVPALAFPLLPPSGAAASQTEQPAEKALSPSPTPSLTVLLPLAEATPAADAPGGTPLQDAAITLRKALVNILCIAPPTSGVRSISGSGVFIDSKGTILTNAHIAQFLLLADYGVSCTIRTGTPATPQYTASLIYIPRAWVMANAGILAEEEPVGTGERDYALLAVTNSATKESLPSSFPHIPLATDPPSLEIAIAIASYASQSLGYDQIKSSLYPTVVFGSVKDIFTFTTTTVDVIALGGSAAAQQGSSGGGVTDESGMLIGTITTSTVEGSISSRNLDAITASYIRSAYASEAGQPLDVLLAKPLSQAVSDFAAKIPALKALLVAGLTN